MRQALTSGLNTSMYKEPREVRHGGSGFPKYPQSFLPVISKPPTLPHRFVQCITAASHSQAREQQASQPRHTLFFLNFRLTRTVVRCMIMSSEEHLFDRRVYDDWMELLFYVDGRGYAGGSGIPRGGLY